MSVQIDSAGRVVEPSLLNPFDVPGIIMNFSEAQARQAFLALKQWLSGLVVRSISRDEKLLAYQGYQSRMAVGKQNELNQLINEQAFYREIIMKAYNAFSPYWQKYLTTSRQMGAYPVLAVAIALVVGVVAVKIGVPAAKLLQDVWAHRAGEEAHDKRISEFKEGLPLDIIYGIDNEIQKNKNAIKWNTFIPWTIGGGVGLGAIYIAVKTLLPARKK